MQKVHCRLGSSCFSQHRVLQHGYFYLSCARPFPHGTIRYRSASLSFGGRCPLGGPRPSSPVGSNRVLRSVKASAANGFYVAYRALPQQSAGARWIPQLNAGGYSAVGRSHSRAGPLRGGSGASPAGGGCAVCSASQPRQAWGQRRTSGASSSRIGAKNRIRLGKGSSPHRVGRWPGPHGPRRG